MELISNHRFICLHPSLTDNFLYTAPSNQTQMHFTLVHLLCHSLINTFIVFLPIVVLQKIIQDKETGIMVVPMWPTQSWYPILMSLLVLPPITLPPSKNLLSLPAFPENHPLHRKMSLLICLLSGNNLRALASHPDLLPWLLHPGGKGQPHNFRPTSRSGWNFVNKNTGMSCHHPYPWPWIFCLCCTRKAYLTALSTRLEVCCNKFYNSTLIPLFHLINYLLSDGLWKDFLRFV